MSNSRENVITRRLHGKFGDQVVFRTRNGKSVTADIPKLTGKKPAASQVQTRDKFKLASIWAKGVLNDPVMFEAYAAKATGGRTPYVAAMADFLKAPRISEISCTGYHGHAGDVIRVSAFDDFMVKDVKVRIKDATGNLVEEGTCAADSFGMYWFYTATVEVPCVTGLEIRAIATDNPGNAGEGLIVVA